MGPHEAALVQKIQLAQTEITQLTTEREQTKAGLGPLLAEGNEKKADTLQVRMGELSRALERATLKHHALEGELVGAQQADAAERVSVLVDQLTALQTEAEREGERYGQCVKALLASIEAAFSPWVKSRALLEEAHYLRDRHALGGDRLPEIPLVAAEPLLTALYERGIRLDADKRRGGSWSEWGGKSDQLEQDRRRAAEEKRVAARKAERERRAAAEGW